jgi:hypothetical protein
MRCFENVFFHLISHLTVTASPQGEALIGLLILFVGANCVRPLLIILNGATHKRSVKDGSFVTARSARLREQKELSSGQNFKTHFAFIKFWAPPCETPYEILLQRIVGNGVLDVPMRADNIRPYDCIIFYLLIMV